METLRLFIAIPVPSEITDMLNKRQNLLADELGRDRIKWVGRPHFNKSNIFHLTLVFLGNQKREKVTEISEVMKEICTKQKQFEIFLHEESWFGSPQKIKVIIRKIGGQINQLQQITVGLRDKFEEKMSKRPFIPHLTLGRVRRNRDLSLLEFEEKMIKLPQSRKLKFEINRLVLYQSILHPEGPVYKKSFSCTFQEASAWEFQ
ncbi:MAG: RNA 2',3'-cyclic phosphodiesterase [Deltaproteobacteria bacterium]|jgi:2'-5' RNA ligase|nr:RNA 2',3'-cyclic phosphodiesterase [Deltaproteobacteria bacterium]